MLTLKSGKKVSKDDYIDAKFADLQESYSTLTREDVEEQLKRILAGETAGLTIIGMFMVNDIKICD